MSLKILFTSLSIVFFSTGCVISDHIKYNIIGVDAPTVQVVHLKMDQNLTIADKQRIIENIIYVQCISQTSNVDYISLNGPVKGNVEFKECFKAIKDGYIIKYSSQSNLSKNSAMHIGNYAELGKKIEAAKMKIKNLYSQKEREYILEKASQISLNDKMSVLHENYKKQYVISSIKKIINDKTSFYNKEKLNEVIIKKNNLPTPQTYLRKLHKEATNEDKVASYEAELKQLTSFVTPMYSRSNNTVNKNKKTLHYKIHTPVTYTKDANNYPVTYEIFSADFNEIFPDYQHKDKNIKIIFDPTTKIMKFYNLTNHFIQINSVSLYYNQTIYNMYNNKNGNFSFELAPQAILDKYVYESVKESNYININKSSIKNKNLTFGFAIKYSMDNNTKSHTFFELKKYNLYKLIKNFI